MDIWNNPMINNALSSMSTEDLQEYKKIGEYMYGTVDFQDNKIINNLSPPVEEAVAYIEEGLKSGLLPSDLTNDEVDLLSKTFGEKWYEKYGFSRDEVPETGLSIEIKKDIEKAIQEKLKELEKK